MESKEPGFLRGSYGCQPKNRGILHPNMDGL